MVVLFIAIGKMKKPIWGVSEELDIGNVEFEKSESSKGR